MPSFMLPSRLSSCLRKLVNPNLEFELRVVRQDSWHRELPLRFPMGLSPSRPLVFSSTMYEYFVKSWKHEIDIPKFVILSVTTITAAGLMTFRYSDEQAKARVQRPFVWAGLKILAIGLDTQASARSPLLIQPSLIPP
jgi:hypothetical protein